MRIPGNFKADNSLEIKIEDTSSKLDEVKNTVIDTNHTIEDMQTEIKQMKNYILDTEK